MFEATILPALIRSIECQASGVELISARTDRRTLEAGLRRRTRSRLGYSVADQRCDSSDPGIAGSADRHGSDRSSCVAGPLDLGRLSGPDPYPGVVALGGLEDFELNREGYRRRIGLRCQHYFAACRVVSQTDWLLTMLEQYRLHRQCSVRQPDHALPLPTQPLDVHLHWHVSVDHDPANQWLREQCIALFAQEGAGRTGATAVDDAGCDDGPG